MKTTYDHVTGAVTEEYESDEERAKKVAEKKRSTRALMVEGPAAVHSCDTTGVTTFTR